MIRIKNLKKAYGETVVFSDFNLDIENGKTTAIMGESGCGKTTLLKILSSMTGYEGEIENMPEKISYVFPEDRLIKHLTVLENLKLVASESDALKYLEKVNLTEFKNAYPLELSSGMARRVAILRAFLYGGEVLFLDEPFKTLDIKNKYLIMDFFKTLNEEKKKTVLLITHDISETEMIADKIVVLKKGGEILLNEDVNEFTKERIKEIFTN